MAEKEELSELAAVLKSFRENRMRMTQAQLAEQLGVGRDTYKNWEYAVAAPPIDVLIKLRSLGFEGDVDLPSIPASQLLVPVPYIGEVAASAKVDWTDPFEAETWEYVPPEMGERGRFCCRITSDSCYDLLWPGDLAVFHKDPVPRIGAVILFRCDSGRITVKQLKHDGEGYVLHPLNPRYQDEPAAGSVIGHLVGIVREKGSQRITVFDSKGIRP